MDLRVSKATVGTRGIPGNSIRVTVTVTAISPVELERKASQAKLTNKLIFL
jgi:hypothetical protein